ncbi:MAG: tRNA (adenosine(37)-N6)-threonylcarbamoyltransferase complex dimerization subunit type 1 TsaB [Oscillospiraceae bacterium]|nr:tRNA (adenosine(37)-N6)-threonylcarbamoyltransferase complex dimerization subunit type 1 TsaB [Oscillospiraceae bacterium]
MKILGIDTSSVSASTAVVEDGKVLAESFINVKLTHSETMMPMLEAMLKDARLSLAEIDAFAVTNGPGSFTGLRIGIAAVKGLAFAQDKPCFGVSTMEALAYNLAGVSGVVVPAMDARCQQVYTAAFCAGPDGLVRLEEDCAISLEELGGKLEQFVPRGPVFFVGDGGELCYNKFHNRGGVFLPPPHLRYARAACVCMAAQKLSPEPAASLVPRYLRLPQAERELLQKQKSKGEDR